MSRWALTGFGALAFAASFWVVFGSVAAYVFSRMPGGAREGGGAMTGFFFVGPICGFVGLILGGWLTWRTLVVPERLNTVLFGLLGLVALLVVGTMIALRPTVVVPDDYPGRTAELQVEVSLPNADIDALSARDRLEFEMRSADGTEVAKLNRAAIRREGGRAIVPGVFPITMHPRSKLLAVMKNDGQVMSSTLTVAGELETSTEWSDWQEMEAGLEARWRLSVVKK